MFVKKIIKEACVEGIEEALLAEKKGASRIEYCANLSQGGTTPSIGEIACALNMISIPLAVMIRPRGGDFIYSKNELAVMKEDITRFKSIGVTHFVLGVLTQQEEVDSVAMKELMSAAKECTVTFHRAFDEIENQYIALETLIQLGCHKVLTSGSEITAIAGKERIKKLIIQAGKRIVIIPGAGLTKENCDPFIEEVGCSEIHGTKIV